MSEYTENLDLFKYTQEHINTAFDYKVALNANWDKIDEAVANMALPDQTDNAGKFLTTNGTLPSWTDVKSGASRNIGEIVASTIPLTDAGLHLLDGSLILGNSIYSDFVDYIASIYDASASYFCTEAQWQTSVTTYGVCGKFVYDSVNNTVRLPKYNSKIYTGGGTAPVVGNGITIGLTDGTNFGSLRYRSDVGEIGVNNQGYGVPVGTNISGFGANLFGGKGMGVTTDPTKSGLVAQLSNITTSLDGYYYIVIATSTKTNIQVDIDEIATDLNGKADVDLTNVTDTGYIKMAGAGMPSSRYIDLTLGASGSTYTAPADGYFLIDKNATDKQYLYVGGIVAFVLSASGNQALCATIPCKKGRTVGISYNASGVTNRFRFIYAVGSESEAQ